MIFIYEGNSKLSGIYEIINLANGKRYIGSAQEFKCRWKDHCRSLKNNKHQNKHFQSSFNKHFEEFGNENFLEFRVIEVMKNSTKKERLIREEFWINFAKKERVCLYNANLTPTKEFYTWSIMPKETKQRQSVSAKNRWNRDRNKIIAQRQSSEYKSVLSKSKSKFYMLCNPNGKNVEIFNMKEFCEKNNFTKKYFYFLINGKIDSYLNWTRPFEDKKKILKEKVIKKQNSNNKKAKKYVLCNPNKEIIEIFNMSKFCKDNNLIKQNMLSLANGKSNYCKGWTRP